MFFISRFEFFEFSNFSRLVEGGNCGGLGREVRGERVVGAAASSAVSDVDKAHAGVLHRGDDGRDLARASAVRDSGELVLVAGLRGGGGGALDPRGVAALEGGRGTFENNDGSRNV